MSRPRFYVPELSEGLIALPTEEARHARRSLRLRAGDVVELFDGVGRSALATLEPEGDDRHHGVSVRVDRVRAEPERSEQLTIIVAACKGPRLTAMIEKLTELGVDEIVLTRFERSVVLLKASSAEKLARTALEACKQCGRNRVPRIRAGGDLMRDVAVWRAGRATESAIVLADQNGDGPAPLGVKSTAVVIGPEGGVTDSERADLVAQGAVPMRLARHILRVETAAIAAAARFSDFS
ncbi:MAG: 16S rRNA (uracil(1498)-N(3))-methyltransferase [Phycisphaerales bacterium]|nr:16S rRNA (uracil(1498)-N(3))-methyltransferase [Phycisphaerales bacterium]